MYYVLQVPLKSYTNIDLPWREDETHRDNINRDKTFVWIIVMCGVLMYPVIEVTNKWHGSEPESICSCCHTLPVYTTAYDLHCMRAKNFWSTRNSLFIYHFLKTNSTKCPVVEVLQNKLSCKKYAKMSLKRLDGWQRCLVVLRWPWNDQHMTLIGMFNKAGWLNMLIRIPEITRPPLIKVCNYSTILLHSSWIFMTFQVAGGHYCDKYISRLSHICCNNLSSKLRSYSSRSSTYMLFYLCTF